MTELNGRERFDGLVVDSYEGRFSGGFDVDEVDGRRLQWGDDVIVVLTARVKQATIRETAKGDVRRTHVLAPREVRFASGDLAEQILDQFDLENAGAGIFAQPAAARPPDIENLTPVSPEPPATSQVLDELDDSSVDSAEVPRGTPVGDKGGPRSAVERDPMLAKFIEQAS